MKIRKHLDVVDIFFKWLKEYFKFNYVLYKFLKI